MGTTRHLLATVFPLLAGCGGSGTLANRPLPPLPAPQTTAALVGPRCQEPGRCECRSQDGESADEATPAGPYKRFEFRLGPVQHDLWATVDGAVLYKSRQRATDCFYLDLRPGNHDVRVHSKEESGASIAVAIAELSKGGPWWYPSFTFECNGGGLCDLEGLDREKRRIAEVPRGVHEPCGSVRVRNVSWQTGTMPDALHPGEIVLEFTLQVYKFATEHEPGSPECMK
jgi:hypothetical protein